MASRSDKVARMRRRDGFYRLNIDGDGERKFASVTTILNALNKPALVNWAAKTAAGLVLEDPYTYNTAEKAAGGIYTARDRAGNRGTTVHNIAQRLLEGAPIDVDSIPEHLKGYASAFQKFVRMYRPQPMHLELTVYSLEHGYAGTTDFCGLLGADPDLWLLDYKTGRYIYDEASLQLAAYKAADVARAEDHIFEKPEVQRTGVVLLGEDGTFTFKEVTADLDVFLALKRVWEWTKGVG